MERFKLTAEGFKFKFRTTRSEMDDTPERFSSKLNLLDRWIELLGVEKMYAGFLDLTKWKQFLQCCRKNMTT